MSETIMVVEDEPLVRAMLQEALEDLGYRPVLAEDAQKALALLETITPDLFLLDIRMPGMNGIDLCRHLKTQPQFQLTPVVLLTAMTDLAHRVAGLDAGADDFFGKPFDLAELRVRVKALLRLKHVTDELERAEAVLITLGLAIESRDPYTAGHCERLGSLGVALGERLGLPQEDLKAIRLGGFLHDLGKLIIPDAVLLKTGPLTDAEWQVMKQHPEAGERMVVPMRTMARVRPIIRYHHERWNGSGYPERLAGEAIPLTARILGLMDAYDALRSSRPYKPAISLKDSVEVLKAETKQGLWDPSLLDPFLTILRDREGSW